MHTLNLQEISVTEECAEAHPEEFLAYYSTSEPRQWRIDGAAPTPKKPSGQSCSWLSSRVLIPSTPACDFLRSFTCPYDSGPLIYHVTLTANSGSDPWLTPTYLMHIQDPTGNTWPCDRTLAGPFPRN